MKSLRQFLTESLITESPRRLPSNVSGLIVFDIDDTLLRVKPEDIKIWKIKDGKEIGLTTDEFAKDPDSADPKAAGVRFDYREFRQPEKVWHSIINGTPLLKNLRILDDYVNAGYDFCFLTARSCEEVVKSAIDSFLRVKRNGELQELGSAFKRTLSHAVNDETKRYPGKTDAEKKANILRELCRTHDKVVFVDDDRKNVKAARALGIPNLSVIAANK